MKVEMEIREAENGTGRFSMRSRQTKVYIFLEGESIIENFGNRAARPWKLYRKEFGQMIADALFVKVSDLHWSRTAGCSCGCSPGFKVTGSYNKEVFITVSDADDMPKTTDPELAAARTGGLLSNPTITGAMAAIASEAEELSRW